MEAKETALTNDRDDLVRALMSLVVYDEYQTEYDGRMYTLCPSCSLSDTGEHDKGCEFVAARQLLIRVTGNPKLFDAPEPQSTDKACACGREFKDEFALRQHRRFSQKCKTLTAAGA